MEQNDGYQNGQAKDDFEQESRDDGRSASGQRQTSSGARDRDQEQQSRNDRMTADGLDDSIRARRDEHYGEVY
jgi:hypothetical protein